MSLYTTHDGKIVDAYSGREINLSDEQDRLDWRENSLRPEAPAMNRIVSLILIESERQIAAPAR